MRSINIFLLFVAALLTINIRTFAHEDDSTPIDKDSSIFYMHMEDLKFEPATLTIKQGQTVVFENHEETAQRWPKLKYPEAFPEFNIENAIKPGQNWGITFNKPGIWKFSDQLYPTAIGTINVVEAKDEVVPSDGIEEQKQTKQERFDNFKENIQLFFIKLKYKVFPKAEEKALQNTSIFDTSQDKIQLKKLLKIYGHKKVMTKLLEESGNGSLQDCHQEAHLIGRSSYEVFGKDVFSDVTYDCFSGYLHGAMEAFLREKGTKDVVHNIEILCNGFDTKFGHFECLHGSGHGILTYRDYDIPTTLKECSQLKDNFSQRSCYGGVFMENIISGQGQSLDPAHQTEWLNKDPHFPCDAVNKSYDVQYECYQMQTSRMLYLTEYNYDQVVQYCAQAPTDLISVCYKSLGRDVAGATLHNTQRILNTCPKVPTTNNYYDSCIEGAVNVIIDFHGPSLKNQAKEFCDAIPDQAHKEKCTACLNARMSDFKNK